jgi:CBS domain-containing protein
MGKGGQDRRLAVELTNARLRVERLGGCEPEAHRPPDERLPVVDADGRLFGHVTKTDLVLMAREGPGIG